jgi:hypothetical protein
VINGATTIIGGNSGQGGAVLYNQFIIPPEWQAIPQEIFYSYSVPTWLPNAQDPIDGGTPGKVVTSQAIQRNQTMSDIFVYVGELASNATMFTPDVSFFSIDQVILQWDAGAPALSTLSPYDIYQSLHVVKGGRLSWRQFSGAKGSPGFSSNATYRGEVGGSGTNVVGSYLRITPGIDIPLPRGDAPSCANQKHTLLFTITVTNLSSRRIVPSVNVLMIDTGVFKIDRLVASQQTNIVTPEEVKALESTAAETQPVPFTGPTSVLGGSFLKDVGRFLKKAARPALNVAKALVPAQYQPYVEGVDALARTQGIGMGDMKGGRAMSKKQLKQLAMHM